MPGFYVDDKRHGTHTKQNWPTLVQALAQGHGYFNALAGAIDHYASKRERWDVWYVDPAHYVEWEPANGGVPLRRYYFRFMKARHPLPAHTLISCTRETGTSAPEILTPNPPEDR
jgi:hypothetical protein